VKENAKERGNIYTSVYTGYTSLLSV
jgi:hypothetical protein